MARRPSRTVLRRVLTATVLLVVLVRAASAQVAPEVASLASDFPAGAIVSEPIAARSLARAQAVHDQIQQTYDRASAECQDAFFTNLCLGRALRIFRAGEREVRRVTLEAHDFRRAAQARDNALARADQERRQAAEDALRPEREAQALRASQARARNAALREEDAERTAAEAAHAQAASAARQHDHEVARAAGEARRPADESKAQAANRRKLDEAQEYRAARDRDRAANAQRRADRQAARDAQEVQAARNAAAAAAARSQAASP